jgi:1-acyl-sn-glycerol-3-phosphate acyltransferase
VSRPLPSAVAGRSPAALRFMGFWFERYLRRHLNGLRLARWGPPDLPGRGGLVVVYSNHPGWWDAILYVVLARRLLPGFESFAPMDAAMLAKYPVFARIGAFGVELDSVRGAAAFLRAGEEILDRPGRSLWVPAEGRFADPRSRPLALRPGVARLVERTAATHYLPLAIEYVFWTERGAEALVAFGPAMPAAGLAALGRSERQERLTGALAATMDRLAADSAARDPGRFVPVLEGRAGIGGVYDGWRRLGALARGRRFDPAHHRSGERAG